MIPLSSADLVTAPWASSVDCLAGLAGPSEVAEPCRIEKHLRLAAIALAVVCLCAATGCGKKGSTTAPPAPIRAEPMIEPLARPPDPVWESQTQDTLPAAQPVPADALDPAPLKVERSEPVDDNTDIVPTERNPAALDGNKPPSAPPDAGPAPFRLGQILSAEERRKYNEMIDRDLNAAEQSLTLVLSRGSRQERGAQVRRIRAFITQAGDVRADDLALARNLAARARLLAEDLAGNKR